MTTISIQCATIVLLVIGVAGFGETCDTPQERKTTAPESVCPDVVVQAMTADLLDSVRAFLVSLQPKRVFFRRWTEPVYDFESLPDFSFREGMALSDACYSRFSPSSTDVDRLTERRHDVYLYDDDACGAATLGHWVQVSPVVRHPLSGNLGFFVRVTPRPCVPFGGKHYWVAVEDKNGEGRVTEVVDLGVIEF